MRVDLPKTLSAGPHYLRIDVPELEAGLPWSLLVDTAVKWPKKASAPLGWKVRLTASKKAKRGGKASMSVQLKRTANSEAGPLGVGLSLPPGAKPRRSDLDDAMVTGILHGYELSPGHVDLFFQTGAPAAPQGGKPARKRSACSIRRSMAYTRACSSACSTAYSIAYCVVCSIY